MSRRPWIRAALALFLATAGVACAGGPERAPHQTIPGVDRPHDPIPDDDDDDDEEGSGTAYSAPSDSEPEFQPRKVDPTSSFAVALSSFCGEIANQAHRNPGPIAIFWPVAKAPNRPGENHVNGLGDLLVDEISAQLEEARLTPIAGQTLLRDIETTNRNLSYFQEDRDALDLAERLGARYVVYGTTKLQEFSRIEKDQELQIRLWCVDLQEGQRNVAVLRKDLRSGREARQLAASFRYPSDVRIGSQARSFQPDASLEAKINMRLVASRVVRRNDLDLSGKRVVIDPVQIPSTSQDRAVLQAMMRTFHRNYSRAVERAKAAGAERPIEAALAEEFEYMPREEDEEEVIVRDDGTRVSSARWWSTRFGEFFEVKYDDPPVPEDEPEPEPERKPTLEDALRVIEREMIVSAATPAAQLAQDLSEELAMSLREAGGTFDRVSNVGEREAVISVIRNEIMDEHYASAVDEATIANLKQKGAQFLVRSTLRPGLGGRYDLRVFVHELASGRIVSEAIGFGAEFTAALDRDLKR